MNDRHTPWRPLQLWSNNWILARQLTLTIGHNNPALQTSPRPKPTKIRNPWAADMQQFNSLHKSFHATASMISIERPYLEAVSWTLRSICPAQNFNARAWATAVARASEEAGQGFRRIGLSFRFGCLRLQHRDRLSKEKLSVTYG